MSHCVGLDYKKPYERHGKKFYKPYRNYYATYVWNDIWNRLLWKGFAKHENEYDETTSFGRYSEFSDVINVLKNEGNEE